MRAVYPGRQPGTFAAAQGGGSEYEAPDGSTCPTAAPSSTATRGSMASSGCVLSREFRDRAVATRLRLDFPGPERTRRDADLFTWTARAASHRGSLCRGLHSLYGQPAVALRRTSRSTSAVQLFAGSVPLPATSIVMLLPPLPVPVR